MKSTTQPRHARNAPRRPWARLLATVSIALVVVLVSAASIVAITGWSLAQRVSDNAIDIGQKGEPPPPAIGTYEGGFNILVVGVDNDPNQPDEDGERGSAILNDVNILLHVSQDHKNAVAVSFPRDMIIAHPTCEDPTGGTFGAMSAAPVNEAMGRGGLPCVVRTIENLTGLDIPYAGLVTFASVVAMTDAIGGVPICLTGRLFDDNIVYTNSDGVEQHLDLPAGISEVSGGIALGFLRSRHGVGDGSDLGRISSQQQYLSSLMRKMKSTETLTDLGKLYSLAKVVASNVYLSTSLKPIDQMIAMAQALRTVDLNRLVFVQYPGSTGNPDFPGKVMPNRSAAADLFALIKADAPFDLGADSQGVGTTGVPGAPGSEPTTTPAPEDPAAPVDPAGPVDVAGSPAPAAGPVVLNGVTGQTAQQETCAVPNDD